MTDKMSSNACYEPIISREINFIEIIVESSRKEDLVFLVQKENAHHYVITIDRTG
jgi:hypothetical protein